VMFSAEFQAGASVIPAFAKPGDVIIADKSSHFALQNGMQLSRAEVRWFEHNSVADLRRVLESLGEVFRAQRQRVFVVIESLAQSTGKLFALDEVMKLKMRFPFRLVLDDSLAIGTIGETGRGSCEHFGIDPRLVEVIIFSLGYAVGSVGGMACASTMLCNHMRLNCTGYVFSCSSPPYVAQAAITSLDLLEEGVELRHLRRAVETAHAILKSLSPRLVCESDEFSPYLHLRLGQRFSTGRSDEDRRTLSAIADVALSTSFDAKADPKKTIGRGSSKAEKVASEPVTEVKKRGRPRRASASAAGSNSSAVSGSIDDVDLKLISAPRSSPVLIGVVQYAPQEKYPPPPSLRVSVSALLDDDSIRHAFTVIDSAAKSVMK